MESDPQVLLTEEEEKEFREIFEMFDIMANGYLSPRELEFSIKAFGRDISSKELEQLILEIKGAPSEQVTYPEFKSIVKIHETRWNPMKQIQEIFRSIDLDDTGKISLRNLIYVNREMPYNLAEEDLAKMIDSADFDQDRELDEEEFTNAMLKSKIFG